MYIHVHILAALTAMISKTDIAGIRSYGGYRGYIHRFKNSSTSVAVLREGRGGCMPSPPNCPGRGGGDVWPGRGAGAGRRHAMFTLSTC